MKFETIEDPKVSIIVPVYNGALFLRDAYDILLAQHLQSFEILFVDNNSTDNSVAVIGELQKLDIRVHLYNEKVQGAGAARNTGLKYAKGNYIYFFDVDDALYPNAINALQEVLDENVSLQSVFGNTVKSGERVALTEVPEKDSLLLEIYEAPDLGIRWMNYGTLPGTPSFLLRREVFDLVGTFNQRLRLGEDAAFFVKLGLRCKVGYLDKTILLYYRHQQSTVSQNNRKQAKVFTYWEPLIKEHIPYLKSHEVPLGFKKEVYVKAFGYLPKMMTLTKGLKSRYCLRRRLIADIQPLKIPLLLHICIWSVVLTGNTNLYKAYFFYILQPYVKIFVK